MPRRARPGPRLPLVVTVAACVGLASCAYGLGRIQRAPRAVAVTTTGPWRSMVYLARLEDGGVIVIDLGWAGAVSAIREGLARLNAERSDVVAVLLTHSHRDHIAGWTLLRDARYYLTAAELPYLLGSKSHGGPIPRLITALNEPSRPAPGELEISTFSADTAIALGSDTIYAFTVPGHTPGSAAYLFRGTLFAGDAVSYTPLLGFGIAKWLYSEDRGRSRRALDSLRRRLGAYRVDLICTAHARCNVPDSVFWAEVLDG